MKMPGGSFPRGSFLWAAVLSTAALASVPLDGAVVFTATTKTTGPVARLVSLTDSTVRGSVDGDRGRIEFLESGNVATPKGSVVLTSDGGKTARFFDPGALACRPWVSVGAASPGSLVVPGGSARYESLKVEKTGEKAGPVILGHPTRRYRFSIAYDLISDGNRSRTEIMEELWADAQLSDAAFAIWLTAASARTGNEELDRKLSDALAQVRGALLKRVTVARVRYEGRPVQTMTTTLEVTELAQKKLATSTFLDPFACKIRKPEDRR